MATVNGQEISNKYGGGIVFANNFTVNTNTPLDVRLTKTTKSELLDPTSWVRNSNGQYLVYTGMLVVVTNDTTASNNGIWEYVGPDDVATADPTLETNWVHLISGETTNTTINAAIDTKIQGLDVPGYAQATMTINEPLGGENGSTLTISGIKEVDGKIAIDNDNDKKLEVAIDGVYNESTNKIATKSTVTNAIEGAINGLDVDTIQAVTFNTPENGGNSTLTISGIQEVDGKIAKDDNNKLVIEIDGGYNKTDNKIATQTTVKNAIEGAINGLDVQTPIQAVTFNTSTDNGNTTLTFNGVKEENGVIAQGASDGASTFIVGNAKLKIQIGSDTATDVFSANAQSDSTIKLDGLVFKKNADDVISVITKTAVASNNKLVTEQDIANLPSAMHYKGPINDPSAWPSNVKAGDVYISTVDRNFVHNGQEPPIETGDMIVFNSESVDDFTVVQSNITLGTGDGQVAANVGALVDGKLVVGVSPANGSKGIKTVDFDVTNLTGTAGKNERTLNYDNGTSDTSDATLFHSATIKDTFKVIGKDFTKTINISSTNRSIKIARNAGDNDSTGIIVDLVWNTTIE